MTTDNERKMRDREGEGGSIKKCETSVINKPSTFLNERDKIM
jgi:hypothetical protein